MSRLNEEVQIGDIVLGGVTYKDCVAKFGNYMDGNLAIVIDNHEGRVCVATVNVDVPGVFIKDYSENEGLLKQLVDKGYLEEIGATFRSGFVELPEVKLLGAFAEAVSPWRDQRKFRKEQVFSMVYGSGPKTPELMKAISDYVNGLTDKFPDYKELTKNAPKTDWAAVLKQPGT